MYIGVATISLHVPEARSLKDKRHVVKSFKERLRARVPVSVAEVGDANLHQVAVLGAVVVSGAAETCQEVLSRCHRMASSLREGVLTDFATEIIAFGAGGSGIENDFSAWGGSFGQERSAKDGSGAEPGEDDLPWGKALKEQDDV